MAKSKMMFVCDECGHENPTWEGQCRMCKQWNTYKEFKVQESKSVSGALPMGKDNRGVNDSKAKPKNLKDIDTSKKNRTTTNITELDRTLSGGIVDGQVILIGGNPGVGKSTILMQLAHKIDGKVLYASGEESEGQVALRARRLAGANANKGKTIDHEEKIDIISTNNLTDILNSVDHNLLIVDSIQTIIHPEVASSAGSVTQVRECTFSLLTLAKKLNIPVIIVGHITKEGTIAGPKVLEHMVDTVLYLEGDKNNLFRLLRVNKNRFGDDSEVGIFEMKEEGLIGVDNPSKILMDNRYESASGSAIAIVMEGNRPLTVEVQALTTKTAFGYPKRAASGFNLNRLQLLCAVIQKRLKVNLMDQDVYVNIASGLQVSEPAVDLAVCAAILSSVKNKPIDRYTAIFGEVGLSGEIRNVPVSERREKEAKTLGFSNVVSPQNTKSLNQLLKLLG